MTIVELGRHRHQLTVHALIGSGPGLIENDCLPTAPIGRDGRHIRSVDEECLHRPDAVKLGLGAAAPVLVPGGPAVVDAA
ncbi:Uncharacterised protein [Mycobacteroides abscessus subsp. massiliense]|nr:Uncharacterised protein [Mycobacteroides abscessus subsp. massiliense]